MKSPRRAEPWRSVSSLLSTTADVDAMGTLLSIAGGNSFLGLEKKTQIFIKLRLLSCTGWCKRFRNGRLRRFILDHLMQLPSCMPIGLRLITARLMVCMLAMGFCLITRVRVVARLLLLVKLRVASPILLRGLKSAFFMGNLNALRDWGCCTEGLRSYAMDDASAGYAGGLRHCDGVQYSVRQFIEWSASELGVTLRFEGEGVDEVAVVAAIDGIRRQRLKWVTLS